MVEWDVDALVDDVRRTVPSGKLDTVLRLPGARPLVSQVDTLAGSLAKRFQVVREEYEDFDGSLVGYSEFAAMLEGKNAESVCVQYGLSHVCPVVYIRVYNVHGSARGDVDSAFLSVESSRFVEGVNEACAASGFRLVSYTHPTLNKRVSGYEHYCRHPQGLVYREAFLGEILFYNEVYIADCLPLSWYDGR
jgi:hypothetical protein